MMKQTLSKFLLVAVIAAATALAGLGAIAFAQGPRGGVISTTATALGMSVADLQSALKSGKSVADVAASKGVALDKVVSAISAAEATQLKAGVTAGRITQAQSDAMVAWMSANLAKVLSIPEPPLGAGFGFGLFDGHGGPGGGPGGPGNALAAEAKALNMSEADLRAALQGGKSVADVAKEKNVALDTVISAVVTAQTDAIKAEVTAGRITQAQADQLIARLQARVTQMVNAKGGEVGPRGNGGFPGNRGPRNPAATPAPTN
jgi:hypothetical protein